MYIIINGWLTNTHVLMYKYFIQQKSLKAKRNKKMIFTLNKIMFYKNRPFNFYFHSQVKSAIIIRNCHTYYSESIKLINVLIATII